MAEYVERGALLEDVENTLVFSGRTGHLNPKQIGAQMVVQRIKAAPAADVAPVVHGRWEVVHGVLTPGGDPLLRCPICRARESEHLCGVECHTVWNYCPNCGARMDGE